MGNSSLTFTGGIFTGDKLLVSSELIYVYANPAAQTSQPLPPALRALFEGYEAGNTMARVEVGDWQTPGQEAGRIRKQVFVHEGCWWLARHARRAQGRLAAWPPTVCCVAVGWVGKC